MVDFSFATGEPIFLAKEDIRNAKGIQLPYAHFLQALRKNFSINVQIVAQKDCSMLFRELKFKEDTCLNTFEKYKGLRLDIILLGEVDIKYRSGEAVKWIPGKYTLSYQDAFQGHFLKDKECHVLSFYYSTEYLKSIDVTTPVISTIPRPVPKAMSEMTSQILRNPAQEKGQLLYYEILMRNILNIHLNAPEVAICGNLTEEQVAVIHAADNYLLTNLHKKVTIDELIRHTNSTRYFLKKGFVIVFGTDIVKRHIQRRLEEAKRLLEYTNKPIKQISDLTGYTSPNSLSKEFRNHFEVSPIEWRRQRSGNHECEKCGECGECTDREIRRRKTD